MKRLVGAGGVALLLVLFPLRGNAGIGVEAGAGFLTVYNMDAPAQAGATSFGAEINLGYSILSFLSVEVPFKIGFGDVDWLLVGGGIKASYNLRGFIPALRLNGGLSRASVGNLSSNDPYFGVGVDLSYFFTDLIGAGLIFDFDFIFANTTVKLLTISVGPKFRF